VRDHHDRHAIAQRAPVFLRVLDMRQRIVVRLKIKNRRVSGRVVFFPRGPVAGDPLGREHVGMPSAQP